MTTSGKDGGAAFPFPDRIMCKDDLGRQVIENHEGMSLRDYFAAKAMQGQLANPRSNEAVAKMDIGTNEAAALHAKYAYIMADAMIRAREGGKAQ